MYNALKISYHLILNYYTLFTILNHMSFPINKMQLCVGRHAHRSVCQLPWLTANQRSRAQRMAALELRAAGPAWCTTGHDEPVPGLNPTGVFPQLYQPCFRHRETHTKREPCTR